MQIVESSSNGGVENSDQGERGSRQIPLEKIIQDTLYRSGISQEIPPGSQDFRVMTRHDGYEDTSPSHYLKYTEPFLQRRVVVAGAPWWQRAFPFRLVFGCERQRDVELTETQAAQLFAIPQIRRTRELTYADIAVSSVERMMGYGINPFKELE